MHEFTQCPAASACRVAATRPVYLLRPIPEMPADVPRTLARAAPQGRPLDMATPLATHHQRHALVWAAQDKALSDCGAHVLDPLPYLCANGACPAMDGAVPRYCDDNHLTESGNKRLTQVFSQIGL